MKKILEIVALPIVLVVGYALTALFLLLIAAALAAYLAWLTGLNVDGPSSLAVILDIGTLVGMILILGSRRFRNGATEIWKQLSRNF
ncbi:MAG: hypothetical protein ACXVA9_09500 [Bdellovibrionales bacterium]